MSKILRIGHSPDPDDAYMFYALAKGKVQIEGYTIEHVIQDIQSLNEIALKGNLEVTAISAAVYPLVADIYWILSTGASVGRNYGPVVVSKKPLTRKELSRKRIAVPGTYTTAFLLLRLFVEDFQTVPMDFTQIMGAVKKGTVDAGVVIHEGQMNYAAAGLHKVVDLGQAWHRKFKLPIPLGLDVVHKSLGRDLAKKINDALNRSIRYAMEHEKEAVDYALQFGRGIPRKTAGQFVKMYVNDDTLDLGEEGKKALETLYRSGVELGTYSARPRVEIIS